MVRGWIELALEGTEFAVVGVVETAAAGADLARRRRPRIVLCDYRLPDALGTQLVREIRRQGLSMPVVLMTANPERGFNEFVREAGAQATVLKTGSVDDLLTALREVAAGGSAFDARHPARDPARGALSPRERDVLRLVAQGATNRQIAHALGVGEESVKTLLNRAFDKLGARKRAEAVSIAQSLGLL
jgi:DNA-binding NarL/FixJ family response regulator